MRTKTPAWLWAVPVFSVGILSAVPPFAIALKLQTKRAWLWFAAFAVASLVAFAMVGSQPEDAQNAVTNFGVTLMLACLIGSATYSCIVGKEVWGKQPIPVYGGYSPVPFDPNAAAIADVHAARQKRSEARALAQSDPNLARDLRIGRPDLPRHYDDGGLVDMNNAPAEAMVRALGLTEAQAAQVIDVRQRLGQFAHPDDLVGLAELEPAVVDRVSERVILL